MTRSAAPFNPVRSTKARLVEVVDTKHGPLRIYEHRAKRVAGNYIATFTPDGSNWEAFDTIQQAREAIPL